MPEQHSLSGRLLRRAVKYHVAALIMWPEYPVFVNPQWSGMLIYPPSVDRVHWLTEAEPVDCVTVTVDLTSRKRHGFDIVSCVSVVKRIVGLHDWRVQTPLQLMRALRGMNG